MMSDQKVLTHYYIYLTLYLQGTCQNHEI